MKKIVFFSVLLACSAALAQVLSNQSIPVTINVPTSLDGFSLKVFIQQLATNGGLVLLGVLVSKIPGVGAQLKKLVDFLAANPKH